MANRIRQRPNRAMTEMIALQPASLLGRGQDEKREKDCNEATLLYNVGCQEGSDTALDSQDSLAISIDEAIGTSFSSATHFLVFCRVIDQSILVASSHKIDIFFSNTNTDRIGMGRFQMQIMVAAGLCFASDAMEILLLSFLSLVLLVEWNLTEHQASSITASVFAGAFLGTLALGRMGDLLGRKPVFIFTASMIAIFGVGTAFVQNYNELILFRFLIGFGVGGIVVPFDTLAEFMPTQSRGQRLVSTSYFWTIATLLVPILAYATLGRSQSTSADADVDADADSNWRLFVACCAIPCTVSAIFGMYAVPESPRWLLLEGEAERALKVLRQAAATNGKNPSIVFPTGTHLICQQESESATFCDLLSPEWFRTTLSLWCLWGCYAFLYYGTIITVSLVFSHAPDAQDTASNTNHQRYHFDYLGIIVSSSAEVAGVTWVLITVDRFGRKKCMSVYFFLGGLFMLALCLLEEIQSTVPGEEHRMALIVLAFFSRMLVYSGSSIVWIITAELLTTKIRATGHSVANAVARVGAFLAPFLVSPSEKPSTIGITMFVASLLIVVCVRMLPETSGQPLGMLHQQTTKRDQRRRVPTEENTIV